jgi:hypothetical protein
MNLSTGQSVCLCRLMIWLVFKCAGTQSDGPTLPLQACGGSGRALGRWPSTDEGGILEVKL